MKSDISFNNLKINDLVEYSPIGNSMYVWRKRTEGIIIDIELMIGGKDAWISIEQTKAMENNWCNLTPDYYVIGSVTKIGYGETFRDLKTIKVLKRRARMNEIIIEMFSVTKEAVLVDKWFGKEIDKPIFKLLISGRQKELLEAAKKLEEESVKK